MHNLSVCVVHYDQNIAEMRDPDVGGQSLGEDIAVVPVDCFVINDDGKQVDCAVVIRDGGNVGVVTSGRVVVDD